LPDWRWPFLQYPW